MVEVPRPPPTIERQKEYDRAHGVGRVLHPNPEKGIGDYEPMLMHAGKIYWCEKSLRWKSKKTNLYVNPHLISNE